ncbi:MAG: DUF6316 family protein [Pseudohongiellaceae bacterium]
MTEYNRSTDRDLTSHERTERLFLDSGLWYFRTREGAPIGPFRYRREAEAMLTRFVERIQEKEQRTQARSTRQPPHARTAAAF